MRCAIYCEDVLDPDYFDNEIVTREDYCELLGSYARYEAKNFLENAVLQQDSAISQTSLTARSLLADIFSQIGLENMGPRTGRLDLLILHVPTFSSRDMFKIKYLRLRRKTNTDK